MEEDFKEKNWYTRDGKTIKIGDLTPTHVANIIAMLERKLASLEQINPLDQFDYMDGDNFTNLESMRMELHISKVNELQQVIKNFKALIDA